MNFHRLRWAKSSQLKDQKSGVTLKLNLNLFHTDKRVVCRWKLTNDQVLVLLNINSTEAMSTKRASRGESGW